MATEQIQLEAGWKNQLAPEFEKPYMQELKKFLQHELAQNKVIYPRGREYFAAYDYTPWDHVKVVILGQDPYHGPRQAHGLCFSARPDIAIPPSLKNIYKELQADLGVPPADHGYLVSWARQGVLLLNSTLTVEAGRPGSHQGRGWEKFTDQTIALLNRQKQGLVFVLWGSYAQKKGQVIDTDRHLVLKAPHPSPFSAHRGFFGCRHFSRINEYLQEQGCQPIDWRLPSLAEIQASTVEGAATQ